MRCGTRFGVVAGLCLLGALGARAEGPLPAPVLVTGLSAGDAPGPLSIGAAGVAAGDCALFQEGRTIVHLRAGEPFPRVLPEGEPVTVTLRDSDGVPAAGILLQWKPEGLPNLPEPFGRVRTNEEGMAVVRSDGSRGLLVWVDQPGYLPGETVIPRNATHAEMAVLAERSRVLRVRDAYGRNIAGAELKAFPLGATSNPLRLLKHMKDIERVFRGDPVGRVDISDLGADCAGGLIAPGCALEEIPALDQAQIVVLRKAPQISVTVSAKQVEKPLADVTLAWTFSSINLPSLVFSSEADLKAGVAVITPGAYPCKLMAKARGRVPVQICLTEPPTTGRLDLQLETGIILAGLVVTATGHGIGGAWVAIGEGPDQTTVETSKEGAFELPPLLSSKAPYALLAGADGYVDRSVEGVPARDNLALRIVLDRGSVVSGRVLDEETRQPSAGCKVTFQVEGSTSSQGFTFEAKVAEDGSFLQGGLDPGTYRVRAYGKEGAAPPVIVNVATTEPHDLGDLLLSGHPTVRGTLALPEDREISPEATVRLERYIDFKEVLTELSARSLEGVVSADGTFVIRGAAAGRYRLLASDGGLRKTLCPLSVEKDDVDVGTVLLEKPASLHGHLIRTDGHSVSNWRVILASQAFDMNPSTSFTSDDGSFGFDDLPAGIYRLQAFAPLKLMPEADQRIEVSAGQDANVTVPVGGVTVSAFLQVDGRAASGATASLAGQSDAVFDSGVVVANSQWGKVVLGLPSIPHTAQADDAGQVTFEGVSPGLNQATLSLNDMDYRMPVTIPASPQTPLTLNFRGMELTGRVLEPTGAGAQRALVTLGYQGVGANPANTTATDAEGNFRITGLGVGTILIGCRNDKGQTATASVTISGDQPPSPVTLRLKSGGIGN